MAKHIAAVLETAPCPTESSLRPLSPGSKRSISRFDGLPGSTALRALSMPATGNFTASSKPSWTSIATKGISTLRPVGAIPGSIQSIRIV
jgi:hypothetical protein